MKMKIYIFHIFVISLIFFSLIFIAKADNNYYVISDNKIISNDYKIIIEDKIISDILIDENNIYFYSDKNFYITNKISGIMNYKIKIENIKNFSQSENYIFLKKDSEVLTINKINV